MTTSKEHLNISVIGHVDAGDLLCGHLLHKLGVVDQRALDKLRKEAEDNKETKFRIRSTLWTLISKKENVELQLM